MRSFLLISLGLALTACSADSGDESIAISKNVSPGMDCTFAGTTGELYNPHGELSMFARRGYQLFPQVVSRLTATEAQIATRTVQLKGARIDLSFPNGDVTGIPGTHFQSLFAAPLAPNGGITDTAFELIPAEVANAIAAAKGVTPASTNSVKVEVLAKVVIFGDLTGDEVTTQDYDYPVTVCNDCVTNNLGACPLPAGTSVVIDGANACNPYQDGIVDCCTLNNALVCPATVTAPTP